MDRLFFPFGRRRRKVTESLPIVVVVVVTTIFPVFQRVEAD